MYLCTKENIMHHPEIAIVDPNTLTCLGLKNILEDIIPMATIRVFHSFGELTDDTPDMYAHYFISAQIYFEHTSFFLLRKPKTTEHELSVREIEVLILITKGLINKEIADKLNISLTTVISHRKNITEKLGIKSVSGLTVYAVMNGYIEADRI